MCMTKKIMGHPQAWTKNLAHSIVDACQVIRTLLFKCHIETTIMKAAKSLSLAQGQTIIEDGVRKGFR